MTSCWKRYCIKLQYLGTRYSGWQSNPHSPLPSIQDTVEAAVAQFVGQGNQGRCQISSRTDAGVHALENVMHVDLRRLSRQVGHPLEHHSPSVVLAALNSLLKRSYVRCLEVTAVDDKWHARFNARGRTYLYRVLTGRSVIEMDRAWCIGKTLDLDKMQRAAEYLVGRHDFSSFRAKDCQALTPVKNLRRLSIEQAASDLPTHEGYGQLLHVTVQADSFLYHMVRNLVGTLCHVGMGKLEPEDVKTILAARTRTAAPETAPACGLYLLRVHYNDWPYRDAGPSGTKSATEPVL